MRPSGSTTKTFWLYEMKVYKNMISDRILALNNSIKRLEEEKKKVPLLDLFKMWRNRLIIVYNDISSIIHDLEEGREVSVSIKACLLKDRIYNIITRTSPQDPIYNNVKNVIVGVLAVLENLCKTIQ